MRLPILLVALVAAACGKDSDRAQALPVEEQPTNPRWQYLETMLEADCGCHDEACTEGVHERAAKAGYRYLPAYLLEEDKARFTRVVSKVADCEARAWLGLAERASRDLATIQIARIINGSYARWAMANNKVCPKSLADLDAYRSDKGIKDPWGRNLLLLCGPQAPSDAVRGVGIVSLGPDGLLDTADDIRSWELTP